MPSSNAAPIEWRISDALVPYADAVAFMDARVAAIATGTAPELIWLLEHPPLYTAGTSARATDLVDARFPCTRAAGADNSRTMGRASG